VGYAVAWRVGLALPLEPRKQNQGARYKQHRQSDENEATDKNALPLDAEIKILGVNGRLHATHQEGCGVAVGRDPHGPDAAFDVFGAGVVT
jgi:hypothetical protein